MRSRISTLLIVALLAVCTGAKAQDIHASGANSKANQDESIDKVQYRITYRAQFVNDTTKRDSIGGYVYRDDDMRLDIGSTVSKFYSGRKVVFDKWMKDKIHRGRGTSPIRLPAQP